MNSESYFESDPWECAAESARRGSLGRIVAVAVRATCARQTMDSCARLWQSRLDQWFGSPTTQDAQKNDLTLSILLRYQGPVIARMFFDESVGEPVCDFEIVGTGGLLFWKPEVQVLSVLRTTEGQEISLEHPYAITLETGSLR